MVNPYKYYVQQNKKSDFENKHSKTHPIFVTQHKPSTRERNGEAGNVADDQTLSKCTGNYYSRHFFSFSLIYFIVLTVGICYMPLRVMLYLTIRLPGSSKKVLCFDGAVFPAFHRSPGNNGIDRVFIAVIFLNTHPGRGNVLQPNSVL
jgi:hypothetical protein